MSVNNVNEHANPVFNEQVVLSLQVQSLRRLIRIETMSDIKSAINSKNMSLYDFIKKYIGPIFELAPAKNSNIYMWHNLGTESTVFARFEMAKLIMCAEYDYPCAKSTGVPSERNYLEQQRIEYIDRPFASKDDVEELDFVKTLASSPYHGDASHYCRGMASYIEGLIACRCGDFSTLSKILNPAPDEPDKKEFSETEVQNYLYEAIISNHPPCVKVLVKETEVSINEPYRDENFLAIAVGEGHLEIVKILVENKADISAARDAMTQSQELKETPVFNLLTIGAMFLSQKLKEAPLFDLLTIADKNRWDLRISKRRDHEGIESKVISTESPSGWRLGIIQEVREATPYFCSAFLDNKNLHTRDLNQRRRLALYHFLNFESSSPEASMLSFLFTHFKITDACLGPKSSPLLPDIIAMREMGLKKLSEAHFSMEVKRLFALYVICYVAIDVVSVQRKCVDTKILEELRSFAWGVLSEEEVKEAMRLLLITIKRINENSQGESSS